MGFFHSQNCNFQMRVSFWLAFVTVYVTYHEVLAPVSFSSQVSTYVETPLGDSYENREPRVEMEDCIWNNAISFVYITCTMVQLVSSWGGSTGRQADR